MKLKKKELKQRNLFIDKHIDKRYKLDWNHIKLSGSDGYQHNQMVANICVYLHSMGVPYATQVRFKSGYRPDIICPIRHVCKIIEVRDTETDKKTKTKEVRIPPELLTQIIYVDAKQDFQPKLVL